MLQNLYVKIYEDKRDENIQSNVFKGTTVDFSVYL